MKIFMNLRTNYKESEKKLQPKSNISPFIECIDKLPINNEIVINGICISNTPTPHSYYTRILGLIKNAEIDSNGKLHLDIDIYSDSRSVR